MFVLFSTDPETFKIAINAVLITQCMMVYDYTQTRGYLIRLYCYYHYFHQQHNFKNSKTKCKIH